jgi:hypothetical protein
MREVESSTRIAAEPLALNADGAWPADPEIIGPGGVVTLVSIAFSTPPVAIYRMPPLAVPR